MKSFLCLLNVSTAKSDVLDRPYFGDNARNVTALADATVTLKCTVKNRGNRTVSARLLTRFRHKSYEKYRSHSVRSRGSGAKTLQF